MSTVNAAGNYTNLLCESRCSNGSKLVEKVASLVNGLRVGADVSQAVQS